MFGNCCFKPFDARICMGTASSVAINTGNICEASDYGFFPVIAWSLTNKRTKKRETTHFLENVFLSSNMIIQWAKKAELFEDPMQTSEMAYSVADTDGVFFIPENHQMECGTIGFVGVKESTKKEHLVRAILEGIAFTVADMFLNHKRNTETIIGTIRIDGGLSNNDFLCQTISNLCNVQIQRATSVEMTAQGIAYLCAYNCGLFGSFDEIAKLYKVGKTFTVQQDRTVFLEKMEKWKRFYRKPN
jgi:putative glycerol kinase 5